MTDIVERLRKRNIGYDRQAADEIERLRAALAWVDQVRPGTSRDGGGGAYVRMTWDEFNAMREAIGLKPALEP